MLIHMNTVRKVVLRVVGTLSTKHNFKGSLIRHSTLSNIYETINPEQEKTKTLQPSCKDLVTSKERITDAPINQRLKKGYDLKKHTLNH